MDPETFEDRSDEELVELARASAQRTRAILATLYERHHVGLFNFLSRYVGDPHQAEDLLQETFLRVLRSLDGFRPDRRVADWIYTIALNAARDAFRRKRPAPMTAEPAAIPPDAASQREETERLGKLLLQLPDEERAVFLLARVEGRRLQEIADLMGFSLRTAKNRLADAIDRLARGLNTLGVA